MNGTISDVYKRQVHILPPFYLSIWAYCVYALLIIGCSLYTVMYFKRRSKDVYKRQVYTYVIDHCLFERTVQKAVFGGKIIGAVSYTHLW